jgi:NRAMP (natural resistance-associated macrophage protein)-like metal ion transporter
MIGWIRRVSMMWPCTQLYQPMDQDDAIDLGGNSVHLPDPAIAAETSPGRDTSGDAWWKKLGPGLITGAADDDPSGIATYSQGGAQYGYNVSWTLLVTYPLMVGIQLASARIGRITGKGLTENFARFCPRWIVYSLVFLLVIANVINLGADLNAMGDSIALVVGGPKAIYAVGLGTLSLLLQVFLPYERYVKVLKWMTLSLLAYVGVGFAAHVDWGTALRSAVIPKITWNKDYATTIVAILGTTISPYLFFWQAAQEVEEIKRVPSDQPLRIAPRQAKSHLRRLRIDTAVGMGFSNLIAFFMIVATAATLHAQGVTNIETTSQAAQALKPIAGQFAFLMFALGILGTGLLALPVLAGSAAYAVASLLRIRKGLDLPLGEAKAFYAILAASMLIGALISASGLNPIRTLYWAAVINAVISVPIMVAVMIAASHPKIIGPMALPTRWKFLGWAATAAMAAATVTMFFAMLD